MLKYRVDVLELLKKSVYNTGKMRREKLLDEASIQKLRHGEMVGNIALNKLCELLQCQPGSLIKWIPDNKPLDTEKGTFQPPEE